MMLTQKSFGASFLEVLLKYCSSLFSIPFGVTTPQVDCEGYDQGGDVAYRSLFKSLATELLVSQAKDCISEGWLSLRPQFQCCRSKLVGNYMFLYRLLSEIGNYCETDQLELTVSSGLDFPGYQQPPVFQTG